MSPKAQGVKQAAANRKAFHDYFVLEKYEAGIELSGTEVKSIRAGTLNLKDSYCTIKNGEIFARGIQSRPLPRAKASHAQAGDTQAQRPRHAGWSCAHPAVCLF